MSISFQSISHRYAKAPVLRDVTLDIKAGEIVCILGPSGSGKTTLLRLAAGLEAVCEGSIKLGDTMLADPQHNPPPEQRPVGLVFQDHALFPHLSVADNVAFGISASDARPQLVEKLLAQVGLQDCAQRYPHTLSGGQQQRVALVRALATEPKVMLLDEPFASVDAPLRRRLRADARGTLKESNIATLLVTHDPEEALAMADRIAVLVDGRLVQFGTPEEIWRNPANVFVGETFGAMQTLEGTFMEADSAQPAGVDTVFGRVPLRESHGVGSATGAPVQIGVAPMEVLVSAEPGPATVLDCRFTGSVYALTIELQGHKLTAHSREQPTLRPGQAATVRFTSEAGLIYN